MNRLGSDQLPRFAPRPLARIAALRETSVLPAALLFYATLLPPEMNFDIGTVKFFAYRIVILCLFPWVLMRISSGEIRFRLVEFAVIAAGLWALLAYLVRDGLAGMEAGVAIALDIVGAYLIGRCSLQSAEAFRRFVNVAAPGTFVVGCIIAFESIAHQPVVRPLARSVFGGISDQATMHNPEVRLGLLRAAGPFPHPILGGLQLGSLLPLFLLVRSQHVTRLLGALGALSGAFALSSAAFMSLALGLSFVAYEALSKRLRPLSWKLALIFMGVIALVIQIFSGGGLIRFLIRNLTLDAQTGYYRLMIWDWGGKTVENSPFFGIGRTNWIRPDFMGSSSVDAHWLDLAMRDGLPASLLLGAGTIGAITLLSRKVRRNLVPAARGAFVGAAISVGVMSLLMFTVTFWGTTNVWFCLLLGAATGLARQESSLLVTKPAHRRASELGPSLRREHRSPPANRTRR